MLADKRKRKQVSDISPSILVCLSILLKQENIESKMSSFSSKIKSKEDIVTNILDILTHDDFAAFRLEFASTFSEKDLFAERLNLVKDLPVTTQDLLTELFKNIKDCELEFMQELKVLFNETDNQHTIRLCNELLDALSCIFEQIFDASNGSTAGDNVYGDCQPPYNNDPYLQQREPSTNSVAQSAPEPEHRPYSFLNAFYAFKTRVANTVYEHIPTPPVVIVNAAHNASSLLWRFSSGVQYTFGRIHAVCIGPRQAPATNPESNTQDTTPPTSTQGHSLTLT